VGLLGVELRLGLGQRYQRLGDLAEIGRVPSNLTDPDAAFAAMECSAHVHLPSVDVRARAEPPVTAAFPLITRRRARVAADRSGGSWGSTTASGSEINHA
jgi:hypothetical protein